MDVKYCNYCQIEHPVTNEYWYFHNTKNKGRPTGCKKYRTESRRKYVEKNRSKWLNYLKEYHKVNYEKTKDNFSKYSREYRQKNKEQLKNKAKNYYLKNKEKIQKKHSEYRKNNKENIKLYNKKYNKENKDLCKQQKKEYRERTKSQMAAYFLKYKIKNKEKIQKRQNAYEKNRRKIDVEFNIRKRLRNSFHIYLKKAIACNDQYISAKQKVGSVLSYLGMEMPDFIKYLESLWRPGMSWNNYGYGMDKWNIDHIYPLSLGDSTDPEFLKKVWHYTNLRSLWQLENIKKGNKIIKELL